MCLIAILYRVIDHTPLILAANREEAYARGGTPLDLRAGAVPFIAGLDPAAGGTWFGVNASNLMIAVTNRHKSKLPTTPRSRGMLVRDLLALSSARAAAQTAVRELDTQTYAGCNVVCADMESLWIVHAGDWLRIRSLAPGYHVVTNGDINDPIDPRIQWTLEQLHAAAPSNQEDAMAVLKRIAQHAEPPAPICLHGDDRGTVAGTLLALNETSRSSQLLHAQGSPDRVEYVDRTDLLWELDALKQGQRLMSEVHRIRLRGPWQVEPFICAEEVQPPVPKLMSIPCTWRDGGWPGFAGSARHTRPFGQPRLSTSDERVWLVVEKICGRGSILLNERPLGSIFDNVTFRADVTDYLKIRNRLVIDVAADNDSGGITGEVVLEIAIR